MRFIPLLILAFGWFVGPSKAEDNTPIAVDEVRCVHLLDLGEEDLSFLLAWLDGYFNHMYGTTTLSDQNLANLGKMIEQGCRDAPDRLVMELLSERIRQDTLSLHP